MYKMQHGKPTSKWRHWMLYCNCMCKFIGASFVYVQVRLENITNLCSLSDRCGDSRLSRFVLGKLGRIPTSVWTCCHLDWHNTFTRDSSPCAAQRKLKYWPGPSHGMYLLINLDFFRTLVSIPLESAIDRLIIFTSHWIYTGWVGLYIRIHLLPSSFLELSVYRMHLDG